MSHRHPLLALLSIALVLGACRRAEVASYRIPKEKETGMPAASAANMTPAPAEPAAGAGMAATPVATAQGADLVWTAPAHWQPKQASAMRKGSYTVTGEGGATADLSITAFPGDVGGEVANVNRWRGQLQLAPLVDAEISAAITRLKHDGLTIGVVDFASPAATGGQRMLGAMVAFDGSTWFFKLTGPDALVAKEKPAFLAFLQTVKSAAPTP